MQFYEDLVVGVVSHFGSYPVTREEVVAFASKYDPQPFHLDDAAAAQTHFGRLSASGWHTCAMTMAMLVEQQEKTGHRGLGSPGVDELRWHRPVYPGDTLRVETEILEKRRSKTRPERGIYRSTTRVFNQDGVMVMSMTSNAMVETRDPTGSD
ncbi:MaoC-like dehydratase [Novosphingobium nitrogenifigens DSM 19370]|uniref:MaoC-like dehydratase n=1 Tax=Novosphingobium nitrogenifigens DSM 19370 TaxID=983920 RepID=F1Z911_9SPHN|nr:MaoC family dehydratase [Novosphingobium nitrogenifigens]EGD58828.1 MaoC-like dehydratase [Novosphingobium nitrogenifigens DSM 19370]